MRALQRLPGTDVAEAFAVNASGVVVGVSIETGDPGTPADDFFYPTIWFPEDWTGGGQTTYTAWTPYNLGDIVGAGASGAANDINDANIVVGYIDVEDDGVFFHRPFVWDLSAWIPNGSGGGAFRHHILGDFGETELRGGEAHGINNESDPLIVGWAARDAACFPPLRRSWGFYHRLSTPDPIVSELEPPEELQSSRSYAVTSTAPYRAVGEFGPCNSNLPCADENNPLAWDLGPPVGLVGLPEDASPARAVAQDINDAALSVGYRFYADPSAPPESLPITCRHRAVLWDAATALKDLHFSAGFDVQQETDARAITQLLDASTVYIVGAELQLGNGVLWRGSPGGSTWSKWLDNDLEKMPCDQEVRRLNDVNACLWLVGARAGDSGDSSPQAVLLLPSCPGDANIDGKVDALDLALVIGAWGTTWTGGYGCESESPDLNEDGLVDANDLAIVLGSWGPCCRTFLTESAMSGTALMENLGAVTVTQGTLASPEVLISVLGFSEPQSLASWLDAATPEQRTAAAILLLNVSSGTTGGEQ